MYLQSLCAGFVSFVYLIYSGCRYLFGIIVERFKFKSWREAIYSSGSKERFRIETFQNKIRNLTRKHY